MSSFMTASFTLIETTSSIGLRSEREDGEHVHEMPRSTKVLAFDVVSPVVLFTYISTSRLRLMTSTELNHRFYTWQMEFLARDGKYYRPFRESTLFAPLMDAMRGAAAETLVRLGFSEAIALRKAAHQTVFWVSGKHHSFLARKSKLNNTNRFFSSRRKLGSRAAYDQRLLDWWCL